MNCAPSRRVSKASEPGLLVHAGIPVRPHINSPSEIRDRSEEDQNFRNVQCAHWDSRQNYNSGRQQMESSYVPYVFRRNFLFSLLTDCAVGSKLVLGAQLGSCRILGRRGVRAANRLLPSGVERCHMKGDQGFSD